MISKEEGNYLNVISQETNRVYTGICLKGVIANMEFIYKIYAGFILTVEWIATWLCALAVAALAIVMTLNVLFRYFINYSMPWTSEVSLFLFAWVTFLGASLGVHRNDMAAVTIVIERFKGKSYKISQLVVQLMILVFASLFFSYALNWFLSPSTLNATAVTINIKMWVPYMVLPIGMVLIILFSIDNILKIFLKKEDDFDVDAVKPKIN